MAERGRLTAVLFDLDDTLFDHDAASRAGLAAVRAAVPCLAALDAAEVAAVHRQELETLHAQVLAGRLTLAAARAERFRRLCAWAGEPITPAAALELAATYRAAYQVARAVVPGAPELLRALRRRGLRLGIVTNNELAEQRQKLDHLGLTALVDDLLTSEEIGHAKPDRRIFEAALARHGCQVEAAVMVGDSWPNDVLGARGVGLRAVWLNRHGHACPDPALAVEILAFNPIEATLAALLG